MARLALVPSAIPRAGLPLTGNRGGAPGGHGACVAADAALVVLARGCAPIMHKNRLEAFSDGVLAIIITIMVLELKVPRGAGIEALKPLVPVLLSYVLSFIYVGIYWSNHHHMFQSTSRVTGGILWANLHLLFWLSLFPFMTAWLEGT